MGKDDPLKPSVSVLCKLGSIAVHTRELLSAGGHPFDKAALETLLEDKQVKMWLESMGSLALVPKER
jgi:hypothetical protein